MAYNQLCGFHVNTRTANFCADLEQRIIDRATNKRQNNCGLVSSSKDRTSNSGNAPGHLADDCQLVADARIRQLLSADTRTLVVSWTRMQQFWRRDLCHRRTTSPEQSAAQSQTMWAVIRPVQAVSEDIFIRTVRPRRSVKFTVNCF